MAISRPPIPFGWYYDIELGDYKTMLGDGTILRVPKNQVEDYGMGELVKAKEKYASAYLPPKKGSGKVEHFVLGSCKLPKKAIIHGYDDYYDPSSKSYMWPTTTLTKESFTTAVTAMYEECNPFIDQVIEMEYVGSRVTCNPAPTNTDEDILLLVDDQEEVIVRCTNQGYVGGETYFDSGAITKLPDFYSLRKGDVNLIVTSNKLFYDKFLLATSVCKKLNLLKKNDRITVFQVILYEKGPK